MPRSMNFPAPLRRRFALAGGLLVAFAAAPAVPARAQATEPPLALSTTVVNDGPGEQTNPHISGTLVTYSSQMDLGSEIRHHDLATGAGQAIPTTGAFDFLSDVSDGTIVFTRISDREAIYAYDVATGGLARELDPQPGSSRRVPRIGGGVVVWQDLGFASGSAGSEMVVYDLATAQTTRLTTDGVVDKLPAVAPDGSAVVWTKCQSGSTDCDVWVARPGVNGWSGYPLTGTDGEESRPDTNGSVVVYDTVKAGVAGPEIDVAWRPAGGGDEHRLALPGRQRNIHISGNVATFESSPWNGEAHVPQETDDFEVIAWDLSSGRLYRITDTPLNETLADVSVGADGTVRVVWEVVNPREGDFGDVKAASFRLPSGDGPSGQITDLTSLLKSFNLHRGLERSLTTKLDGASAALDRSDTRAACSQLQAFINEVKAQSGKKITAELAAELLESADRIRGVLECN